MHKRGRVFLNMDSSQPYFFAGCNFYKTLFCNRKLILRYLEVLCHIRIEIGFPGKEKFIVYFRFCGKCNFNCIIKRLFVEHRLASRMSKANWAAGCVRLL